MLHFICWLFGHRDVFLPAKVEDDLPAGLYCVRCHRNTRSPWVIRYPKE